MILHTVNKSPFTHSCFNDCLALCCNNAGVLLIEDGVYAAINNNLSSELISAHDHLRFYALKADLLARGLIDSINPNVTVVDDQGFVELCVHYDSVQSWY